MLLALVMASGSAFAQEVVVEGNRRVDTATIQSYVGGAGSLEDARRNLLQTGLFSDVRLSRRGNQVVAVVRENQSINRVVFEGNRKITKETLEPEVQSKSRGAFSQTAVDGDVARIKDVYRRAGRGLANVTSRVVDLPNGRVDVVFTIDEGSKTGIAEINFEGNSAYSSTRLRNLMASTEMNLLSFLKTSDVYDPDRIAADEELIRRFYLKNGYADFQITATDVTFDAEKAGYVVLIRMSEGEQYRVGTVGFESRVSGVDPEVLKDQIQTAPGEVYNADSVEKSLTNMTTEAVRRGYAFVQARPTGQRDPASHTVSLGYVVEEGPHVYIERINIRGNTRTRDYVIRREFDVAEGDAYNKVLIDRAERRLNNLGYFKKVRITNEPGSSADRVVVNVDVEDQPTGAFSVSGGYSTSDGAIGEVSISESNFLGRGQFVRLAGQLGQRSNGVDFSFTEPYFLGYRLAAGFDLFDKYTDSSKYARYENRTEGFQLRLGFPITEEAGITLRYSLFQTKLKVPNTYKKPYDDCSIPLPAYTALNPDGTATYPTCAYDGEASTAVKEAQGKTLTSLAGVTLAYNSLDNFKNPHSGIYAEAKPDVAGLGGDSKYFRATGEFRYYHEIPYLLEDMVGVFKLQGGHIQAIGDNINSSNSGLTTSGGSLRLVDHFFMGPTLVRGFATSGIGPRDISSLDSTGNALGGTNYWGASVETQFPLPLVPRDLGLKGALFADAGSLFDYKGPTAFDLNGNKVFDGASCSGVKTTLPVNVGATSVQPECVTVRDKNIVRTSVGVGLLWNSPLGPIRFDYAFALNKDKGTLVYNAGYGTYVRVGEDKTQAFRFSGGTRF